MPRSGAVLLFLLLTFAAVQKTEDIIYRYIALLLMLGVFFAQTFSSVVIWANYKLNTAAYASACENKSKPWMHCNGKCQMHRQQQQDAKTSQESPGKQDNKNEITLSSKSFFASVSRATVAYTNNTRVTPLSLGHCVDRATAIFRPPQLV